MFSSKALQVSGAALPQHQSFNILQCVGNLICLLRHPVASTLAWSICFPLGPSDTVASASEIHILGYHTTIIDLRDLLQRASLVAMSHISAHQFLQTLDIFLLRQQFIQTNEQLANSVPSTSTDTNNTVPPSAITAMHQPQRNPKAKHRLSRIPVLNDAWKTSKNRVPFLAVPPEIHLKIFEFLHPVEAVCLSVIKFVILSLPIITWLL